MKMKLDKKMPISLNDQVAHPKLMWPTPRASAAMAEKTENIQKRGTQRGKLEESVARWPTPTARDYKDSGKAVINSDRNLLPQKVAKKDKEQWVKGGGSLNPTWVEWLMGYPKGWTDLNHSETVLSHKSPTTSDQSSSKRWPTPSSTDGQRGDVKNLDGWRKRRERWKKKGVNLHKPLDVAVALEEEEKNGKTN
jgi:hypothetical protein